MVKSNSQMNYRREIDGLRALAVIPVILFHAGIGVFSGGYVGVDIFFVISGYLITGILWADLNRGNFLIKRFYERRMRRILPALFMVVAICSPFAYLILLPIDLDNFFLSVAAVPMFISNIFFWRESSYFATNAELSPLLHTWSLSLEEQFYILFPLFFMLIWRLGKRRIIILLALVWFTSLSLAEWGAINKPAATFYLLPTRAWELVTGSILAMVLHQREMVYNKIDELFSLAGLILIFYSIFTFNKSTPFPSVYTLVPVLGTTLIIISAKPQTLVGRFLSNPFLVGIGLISYSAYLWHHPLFAFAKYENVSDLDVNTVILLCFLTLVLAYLSWRYIETPFRHQVVAPSKRIFTYAVTSSVLIFSIGGVGHAFSGIISSFWSNEYSELVYRMRGNYGLSNECDFFYLNSLSCQTSNDPEILLWGDSYAMHLAPGIIASKPGIKLIQATVSQCAPIPGIAPAKAVHGAKNCIDNNDQVIELIKTSKSLKYVVLSSIDFHNSQYLTLITKEGKILQTAENSNEAFLNLLDFILSLGIKPVIFAPPPSNGDDIGSCLIRTHMKNNNYNACDFIFDEFNDYQKSVREFLKQIEKKYYVIWFDDGICSDKICRVQSDSVFFYRDHGHLSIEGSVFLGKQMGFYQLITQSKDRF